MLASLGVHPLGISSTAAATASSSNNNHEGEHLSEVSSSNNNQQQKLPPVDVIVETGDDEGEPRWNHCEKGRHQQLGGGTLRTKQHPPHDDGSKKENKRVGGDGRHGDAPVATAPNHNTLSATMDSISSSSTNGKVGDSGADCASDDDDGDSSLFPMFWGLWYINEQDENRFVLHEMNRCAVRATIGCLVPGVCFLLVGLDEQRRDADRSNLIAISSIVTGVAAIIGTLLLSLLLRWFHSHDKKKIKDAAVRQRNEGAHTTSISDVFPQTVSSDTPQQQCATEEEFSLNLSKENWITQFLHRNTAVIHEWRCASFNFVFVFVLTLIYREKQFHCRFEPRISHSPEDHTHCPLRLFWPLFFFPLFSVFIGQPRLVFVITTALCIIGITVSIMEFHNTSTFGVAVIYILLIGLQLQAVALKWFEERQSRHRFEAQMVLVRRLADIKEHAKHLADFVNSITPVYLKSRLSEDTKSSVVCIDQAPQAMCLVINIRNALQFMQSMLPSESASALAILSCQCETRTHSYSVHHIRTVGDTMYFVSNLFREDAPSGAAAAVDGIRFCEGLWGPCSALQLCCGLSVGPLAGLPLGTTCIRYDIVGPALTQAQSLSLQCSTSTVAVKQNTFAAMQHLVSLDFEKNDESNHNSGGGDGEDSSHDDDERVYFVRGVHSAHVPTLPGAILPENHPRSSQEISIGLEDVSVGESIVHSSHETGLAGGVGSGDQEDLSLETYGCVFTRFSDPDVETEAVNLLRVEGRTPMAFVSGFYTVLCVLILCTVLDEQKLDADSLGSVTFIVLLSVGCICFVVTGVSAQVRNRAVSTWQHVILFVGCISTFVAANCMRPSLIADSTGYLAVCFCCGALFVGASAPFTVVFVATMVVLELLLGLLLHPLTTRIFFIMPPVFATVINSCLVYHKQDRKTLEFNVRTLAAMQEIDRQDNIRAAVLRSVIPRQLQDRMNRHALRGNGLFKCWGRDDCVVLTVSISSLEAAMAGYSGGNSSSSTGSVPELYEKAAATTGRVEAIVSECKYQTLDVVKVFGGTIMVAGPLDARKRNPDHLQHAVSDALETIEAMLHEKSLRFTAGVVFEQILNAARFSMFPTYELLGPAVNIARSIVAAAPAEMVVASERLASLYLRELPVRPSLCVGKTESWRVRGMGVLRVARINLVVGEEQSTGQ